MNHVTLSMPEYESMKMRIAELEKALDNAQSDLDNLYKKFEDNNLWVEINCPEPPRQNHDPYNPLSCVAWPCRPRKTWRAKDIISPKDTSRLSVYTRDQTIHVLASMINGIYYDLKNERHESLERERELDKLRKENERLAGELKGLRAEYRDLETESHDRLKALMRRGLIARIINKDNI